MKTIRILLFCVCLSQVGQSASVCLSLTTTSVAARVAATQNPFLKLAEKLFSRELLEGTDVLYVSSQEVKKNRNKFLTELAEEGGAFTLDPRLSTGADTVRDEGLLQNLKKEYHLRSEAKALVVLFTDKPHNEAFLIHELTHVQQGDRGQHIPASPNMVDYVSSPAEVEAVLNVIAAYKYLNPQAIFRDFWLFHNEFDIGNQPPQQLLHNPSFLAHKFLFESLLSKNGKVHLSVGSWISDPLGESNSLDTWIKAKDLILSQMPVMGPKIAYYVQNSQ